MRIIIAERLETSLLCDWCGVVSRLNDCLPALSVCVCVCVFVDCGLRFGQVLWLVMMMIMIMMMVALLCSGCR